jgi:hypothetical protein
MLEDLTGGLLGALLGGSLSDRLADRKAGRLRRENQVECALRVVDGQQSGLPSRRWGHGTATLSEGLIDMGWTLVEVTAADLASVRSPTTKEGWSINPRTKLVRLESATGVIEWAVPEKQFDWAVEQVLR